MFEGALQKYNVLLVLLISLCIAEGLILVSFVILCCLMLRSTEGLSSEPVDKAQKSVKNYNLQVSESSLNPHSEKCYDEVGVGDSSLNGPHYRDQAINTLQ